MSARQWRHSAACKGNPTPFFDGARSEAKAKAICRHCPVQPQCLQEALKHPRIQGYPLKGVWGGLNSTEIQALARKREQDNERAD